MNPIQQNNTEETSRQVDIDLEYPLLIDVRTATLKIEDKNAETPPVFDLALTLEAGSSVNSVFEFNVSNGVHTLKLKESLQGVLCARNNSLHCLASSGSALLVTDRDNVLSLFPFASSSDALLVADSTAGWSLEPVSDCSDNQ